MKATGPRAPRRGGAPRAVGTLVDRTIRRAGESRGFAELRLLTHWAEFAGRDVAAICRPVKVTHPRKGLGATLVLLTTGAQAPVLQMRLPQLRERVNSCYGYNAIAAIQITQTAPTGFAEGQAAFDPAPRARAEPPAAAVAEARARAEGVADDGLRAALERLGTSFLAREGGR
ncbi:DUF721 domain-containing protein [Jannaschia sp. W003]|uniref:DUF721 domain-containing protein n=1 Tax=Jannaschia sp. W003 TaxID=2867012 RepID=UPI0021A3F95E|nr:DUF721 domain-containing protein [Jannaschia sp. W003]UWQ21719.1 DUF721 domain-containing protein [Jannaschia sp. W003]